MCCINTTETAKTEDRKEIIMKKQLKKTVSLGLAAVMALGLTACGGGSSSSDSTTAAAGSGETKTEAAADSLMIHATASLKANLLSTNPFIQISSLK